MKRHTTCYLQLSLLWLLGGVALQQLVAAAAPLPAIWLVGCLLVASTVVSLVFSRQRRESGPAARSNPKVDKVPACGFGRALLESMPSPAFLLGEDGRMKQMNPAAQNLNSLLDCGTELAPKLGALFDECLVCGDNYLPDDPSEALLLRVDEAERYYLPRIFKIESNTSVGPGWVFQLYDVTRMRWLDDLKTNLLSTVSHEIKTPLTSIRMVLHLLLEDGSCPLTRSQKTMLASAGGDCERLLATLNSMLKVSRAQGMDRPIEDLVPESPKKPVLQSALLASS